MRILLDENFPLALERQLRAHGHPVEHIILLGMRGLPDARIRERLRKEHLLFLTQDTEFEGLPHDWSGVVILSRIDQGLSIQQRVQLWESAVERILVLSEAAPFYELRRDGELIAGPQPRRG